MNCIVPLILSASRETDIPAYYADWFVSRLREGWCGWKNTYSGIVHKGSFDKTRMIVFWSKNHASMLERLDEIEALGFRQYYFQFTLNDYVAEGLEPNVPPVAERIDTFRRLADRIGKERVIWRFDPLMLTDKISIDSLLERIAAVGRQLKGYTEKLVFSFIDISAYRKVQRKACGCIVSKDIGAYNTCPHLCRYCYANASPEQALANWRSHRAQQVSATL